MSKNNQEKLGIILSTFIVGFIVFCFIYTLIDEGPEAIFKSGSQNRYFDYQE